VIVYRFVLGPGTAFVSSERHEHGIVDLRVGIRARGDDGHGGWTGSGLICQDAV